MHKPILVFFWLVVAAAASDADAGDCTAGTDPATAIAKEATTSQLSILTQLFHAGSRSFSTREFPVSMVTEIVELCRCWTKKRL